MKRYLTILASVMFFCSSSVLSQQVIISGANLYIAENSYLKISDMNLNFSDNNGLTPAIYSAGLIRLNANLNINSSENPFYSFLEQNGTVHFYGNINSEINGTTSANMQNLIIDKSSGDILLNIPLGISGNLSLSNGIIWNNGDNVLSIALGGIVSGGGENSHVTGTMAKEANALEDSFLFPLGTGEYYRPVGFFNVSDYANISAKHMENNPEFGWDTEPLLEGNVVDGREMHRVSKVEYWEMIPDQNVTAGITLSWDDSYSQINEYSDLLVANWNNSENAWRNLGASSYDLPNKRYDSYLETDMFGILTLGSAQIPPLLGDVNNDGHVNVLDVVWMVNFLNGNIPAGFNEENADVTLDGNINIADLTALIDLIMDGAKYPSYVSSEPGHIFLHEDGMVRFDSDGTLTAISFQLIGEELYYADFELLLETNHRFSFNIETGKGTIYSMDNTIIPKGMIDLFQISDIDAVSLNWGQANASNVAHMLVDVITYETHEETAIPELISENIDISVFPNPGSGDFVLRFDLPYSADLSFEVIDERGRMVERIEKTSYDNGRNQIDFNLANQLNSGLYLLRVIYFDSNGNETSFIFKDKIVVAK